MKLKYVIPIVEILKIEASAITTSDPSSSEEKVPAEVFEL